MLIFSQCLYLYFSVSKLGVQFVESCFFSVHQVCMQCSFLGFHMRLDTIVASTADNKIVKLEIKSCEQGTVRHNILNHLF